MAASALIYWHLEKTWSVQSVNTICDPKKNYGEVYVRGELVKARFAGGTYPGLIVKISSNREDLKALGVKVGHITSNHNHDLLPEELLMELDKMAPAEAKPEGKIHTSKLKITKNVDEAKIAKAVESKRRNEREQQRAKTLITSYLSLQDSEEETVGEQDCSKPDVKLPTKRKLEDSDSDENLKKKKEERNEHEILPMPCTAGEDVLLDRLKKLEDKEESKREKMTKEKMIKEEKRSVLQRSNKKHSMMDNMYDMLESILNCKSCMRKAYKKLDYKSPETTPRALASPAATVSSPPPPVTSPIPDVIASPGTSAAKSDAGQLNDDDYAYVGDPAYNIRIPMASMERANKTARTAEKLALNLIEFILSSDEMIYTTVYGNSQHGKKAMDEQKRKALRSHIFGKFPPPQGKAEEDWGKIVKSVNDKIRKFKKGIYKN